MGIVHSGVPGAGPLDRAALKAAKLSGRGVYHAGRSAFKGIHAVDKFATPATRAASRAAGNVAVRSGELMWKGGGRQLTRGFGKMATTSIGTSTGFGILAGALTYDRDKHDLSRHMSGEISSMVVDDMFINAGLSGGPILGALAIGAAVFGVSPGAMVKSGIEKMGAEIDEKKYGVSPITQNKRTMAATRSQLSMLGQGSNGHSMLGHEAQMMHN